MVPLLQQNDTPKSVMHGQYEAYGYLPNRTASPPANWYQMPGPFIRPLVEVRHSPSLLPFPLPFPLTLELGPSYGGLGSAVIEFLCILASKSDIWWQQI